MSNKARFAAYGASKAALNQALRVCTTAQDIISSTNIPGTLAYDRGAQAREAGYYNPSSASWRGFNVSKPWLPKHSGLWWLTRISDMSKIEIPWDIDGGQTTAKESVLGMINVIESKTVEQTGTFWTWENEVSRFMP